MNFHRLPGREPALGLFPNGGQDVDNAFRVPSSPGSTDS